MAKAKPRQVRVEQRSGLEAMQRLSKLSDEELEQQTRHKAAALAILGARAAERYDAVKARSYYQRAIAAARPQDRMALRRMAEASLALAERRAGDLKDAVERMGQKPPSSRQLLALRIIGLLVPPPKAGRVARVRGMALILLLFLALLAVAVGIAELVGLPFGGISVAGAVFLGLIILVIALVVLFRLGRRRQQRAQAERAGP